MSSVLHFFPLATSTDVSCPGNGNGNAISNPKGATPPYTYNWSPLPGATARIWNLSIGMYYISITDSRGCEVSEWRITSCINRN